MYKQVETVTVKWTVTGEMEHLIHEIPSSLRWISVNIKSYEIIV